MVKPIETDPYSVIREERRKESEANEKRYISIGLSIMFAVLGVFAFFTLLGSLITIEAGTVGVLLEFGNVKEVWQPGLHVQVPFIQTHYVMSTQTMKYETSASAASNDLQIVSTNVAVNYHADQSQVEYLFTQFRGEYEARLITPLVQEAVKANTAKYTAEELIKKRETAKMSISATLKDKLMQHGIIVDEVSITNFDFSPEFNKAIESKVVVEQEKLQMQLELEKKQIEVQKLVAEQNATAQAQIIKANADAESMKLRAQGQAIADVTEASGMANATIMMAQADRQAIDLVQGVLTDEYVAYQYSQRWNGELPYFMSNGGSEQFLVPIGDAGGLR
jgi:regulator of protease activity HflC (stomatin/prohibitin superfamily)